MPTRALALAAALSTAGCAVAPLDLGPGDLSATPDLGWAFPGTDLAAPPTCETPNECGDCEPGCGSLTLAPQFPLPTDMPADPHVSSSGIARDPDGYLELESPMCGCGCYGEMMWIANATDWGRGTISKFNSRTGREIARYLTVTCGSLKTGSSAACDGQSGCCSMDDSARFAARLAMQADPGHQPVQLTANSPSRTGVDFDGDVWVENRAPGGQASISKIADDITTCIDRNKSGKIETSSDVNGDGLIETDCNGDGKPDDIASVKGKPCANNLAQEFYGLDDECVLFTTNIGAPEADGRPLALGPGAQDFGPSDAWAGTRDEATIYRTDGATGLIKDRAILPMGCRPDGLAIDSSSIGWSVADGPGPLCWFNTKIPADLGQVRSPQTNPISARVITVDRDQNLWLADRTTLGALRYTPDRKAGTTRLGSGFWTTITDAGKAMGASGLGAAIEADSRNVNAYFTWLALDQGFVVRIPASAIQLPPGMDQVVDGSMYPITALPGFVPTAVGVSNNQNVVVVSRAPSAAVVLLVDPQGAVAPLDLKTPPKGGFGCPAGSRCLLKDNQASEPGSDSYSSFHGYGLRNFCRPKGFYAYIVDGHCADGQDTEWRVIRWDSDVPLNTSVTVRARSGGTPEPDLTWGQWTPDFTVSPGDLVDGMPLVPNGTLDSRHLQLELDLVTLDRSANPKVKSVTVSWRCLPGSV